jgi:signal recognition particle subunit SRP54
LELRSREKKMFETLTSRLQETFKKLRGHGKLSEKNISDALREVRIALLEADVNYKVARQLIDQIREKATGQDTLRGIKPGQQVIKIVNDELTSVLGTNPSELSIQRPGHEARILIVGLNGSGKTTTCAKLAKYLSKKGQKPLLVACDTRRPAAIQQLKSLGKQHDLPVFAIDDEIDPLNVCKKSLIEAEQLGSRPIIFDTAGRQHIDEELMEELRQLTEIVNPEEILLVADAMTGQDAVKIAENFHKTIELTGIILSKMDGDARGGAAISLRSVTGMPIRFIGTGEKISDFDLFYPDRISSRILGMGDILSLVEKAQEVFDEEESQLLGKKMLREELNLEDFLGQLKQIKKMGPLQNALELMPGMGNLKGMNVDDRQLVRTEAIILSMTPSERRHPSIINGSRKKRISSGSGTTVQEINQLLKRFMMMKKMMKKIGKMKKGFSIPGMSNVFG